MKYKFLAICLFASMTLQSCVITPRLMEGVLYTGVTEPSIDLEVQSDPNVKPSKTGEASCSNILGLIAIGDCGIQAAMKAGGLSKIHSVDVKYMNILGLYAKRTTIIAGE